MVYYNKNTVGGYMSKNNKILKISLALVIVSALISIAVVMKLKVKKPVFFENFIEVQTSG